MPTDDGQNRIPFPLSSILSLGERKSLNTVFEYRMPRILSSAKLSGGAMVWIY